MNYDLRGRSYVILTRGQIGKWTSCTSLSQPMIDVPYNDEYESIKLTQNLLKFLGSNTDFVEHFVVYKTR